MTWPAALSVAALRVMRTAAGRRALQVTLLVGGLFALGFLCGEQAHAAEGVPGVTAATSVSSVVNTPDSRSPAKPVVHDLAAPVAPVVEHVKRPVEDLVKTVTGELAEAQVKVPLPDVTLPEAQLPELPSLPSVPSLPGLPTLPGQTLPAPVTEPQPSAGSDAPATSSAGGRADDGKTKTEAATYGPEFTPGTTAADTSAHATPQRTAPASTAHAPARQAPTGDPGGALAGKSAVDNGSSRHGDAHAVTPNHRAPLNLAPGAAAGVDAAEIQDRHRDIPVSPA